MADTTRIRMVALRQQRARTGSSNGSWTSRLLRCPQPQHEPFLREPFKSWPFPALHLRYHHRHHHHQATPLKCRRNSHKTSKASAFTTSSISQINSLFVRSSHFAVRTINNCSGVRRDQVTLFPISSPATSKISSVLPKHTKKSFA